MAMTKKERAELDGLLKALRLAKALRWTDPVNPDVPRPTPGTFGAPMAIGFLFVGELGDHPRVDVACSSAIGHSVGNTGRTTTQGARSLYSTRALALKALRNEVEKACAERLARIDAQIDAEINNN